MVFFDNGTFEVTERSLPADEVIPVKLALKEKLNSHGRLDKLKARVCLRGDMQIKDESNPWSPTASSRLLRCFIADAIKNKTQIFQLDFIQAFIQYDMKKRMCLNRGWPVLQFQVSSCQLKKEKERGQVVMKRSFLWKTSN